jgi:hypothetical protein
VKGTLVEPTVVGEAVPAMRGMHEEIFGHVCYAARFESLGEALAIARDNRYGWVLGVGVGGRQELLVLKQGPKLLSLETSAAKRTQAGRRSSRNSPPAARLADPSPESQVVAVRPASAVPPSG